MRFVVLVVAVVAGWGGGVRAAVPVVAAENFYGDVVQQVGGPYVRVTSILSSPEQDPHLFEASPSVARVISGARVVVANGIGYDPWMDALLRAARGTDRVTVVAAALVGRHEGDNPHIWYDPATMLAVAGAVGEALVRADPAHAAEFERRLGVFRQSMVPVQARVAALRGRLSGVAVTATEPVLGVMLGLLGVESRNAGFQLAVMNGTEPAASEVAAFEADLKGRPSGAAGVQQPGQHARGRADGAAGAGAGVFRLWG